MAKALIQFAPALMQSAPVLVQSAAVLIQSTADRGESLQGLCSEKKAGRKESKGLCRPSTSVCLQSTADRLEQASRFNGDLVGEHVEQRRLRHAAGVFERFDAELVREPVEAP
jgi:hypothetical protein